MAIQADARVLVIASDAAMRKTLQSMLVRQGYAVRQAEDIATAVSAFDADPCPLVVAAFTLRDGNGPDLIQSLRQRAPDVAVILFGTRSLQAILPALRSNTTDYLTMPLRDDDLAGALERALHTQAAAAERAAREHTLAIRLAQLQSTQASLVQIASLAALGRLAANLAHEINNPLTPIFGMAELLLDDLPPDHACRAYAEAISASARRIRDVVRSLIDFARPAAHEHIRLDLGPLIQDTLLLTEQQLHDQAISTTIVLPNEPLVVMGSAAQLKQALLLLIDNAREAMPSGGELTIKLSALPGTGLSADGATAQPPRAVIALKDTGVGIAKQWLPFIFEPFYSTKPQVVGVGLGLAVASSILQEHVGMIEVDSVEGRGSTFRIVLPLTE